MKMTTLLLFVALFNSFSAPSARAQGMTGNHLTDDEVVGGNPLDNKWDRVRADLIKWITAGGGMSLNLTIDKPGFNLNITPDEYKERMLKALMRIHRPKFVTRSFKVNGTLKACITNVTQGTIQCTQSLFPTNPIEIYLLIHHEYAALARIEIRMDHTSEYAVSDQIKDFLHPFPQWHLGLHVSKSLQYFEELLKNTLILRNLESNNNDLNVDYSKNISAKLALLLKSQGLAITPADIESCVDIFNKSYRKSATPTQMKHFMKCVKKQ